MAHIKELWKYILVKILYVLNLDYECWVTLDLEKSLY